MAKYLPLVAMASSFIVFIDVVGNGFYLDDYVHLYSNANYPLSTALFAGHGGHFLATYNTIYLILFKLFGLNSGPFFVVLLCVHAGCVYLVYSIIQRLTQQPYLAAFGATLWGMSPINAGSLGWIAVLGHVFATAAILLVVRDLVNLEHRHEPPRTAVLVRMYCLLLVAASSFGIGLGVAMGFAVAFFVWNPAPAQRTRISLFFASLAIVIPLIYFGTSQFLEGRYVDNLAQVPSNLLRLLLVGCGSLLGGPLLVGDVVPLPATWILPVAMALGAIGGAAIVVALIRASSPMRGRILALGILLSCCYGVIALARWFFFEDNRSLNLRYHYMGPALFSVLICLSLSILVTGVEFFRRNGALLYFGWLLAVIIPYNMATTQNNDDLHLRQREQHHRMVLSLETQLKRKVLRDGEGPIYLRNKVFIAAPLWVRDAFADFPGLAGLFIILHPENSYNGRPVRFIEEDETNLGLVMGREGSRVSELVISKPPNDPSRLMEQE